MTYSEENIFANYSSDDRLISGTYKKLKNTATTQGTPIKSG